MKNLSGIRPTEFKVLIAPTPITQKIGSIILPDQKLEHDKYAQIEGRIVAVSHLAFTYATADEWDGKRPKPGDAVLFAKYAGVRVKGPKDGAEYVLVNDKDICATIEE
jgi:co-chaperonin GroES (HSP10)